MPIPPNVAAAAIGAGSQMANGLFQGIYSSMWRTGEREHAYQMTDYLYDKDLEQWNRQNEYDKRMWDLQNEYNSPKAQMARYEEAGLNKNMIYGQGSPGLATPIHSGSFQSKGAPVKSQAPNIQLPDALNMMFMAQQLNNAKKQGEILTEQEESAGIKNMSDIIDLSYKAGGIQNYGKHWFESGVPDGKGNAQTQYEANQQQLLKNIADKELQEQIARWAKMKADTMETDKFNIDKDNLMDRIIMEDLGKGGKYTQGALSFVIPILLSIFKGGK